MQTPLLQQLKRLLPFLLSIGTTLLILGLSLNPTTAQPSSVPQNSPAFGKRDLFAQATQPTSSALNGNGLVLLILCPKSFASQALMTYYRSRTLL